MVNRDIEFRQLMRFGHCACCGKEIERNGEKVIRFQPCISQSPSISLCVECVCRMNDKIKEMTR